MKIKVIRFENYVCPKREHYNDSGADVFAANDKVIHPYTTVKIPLGVGIELPDGYDAVVHCKSGLSSRGILASNSPIDAGYRGEIHAILYNSTGAPIRIYKGEKVGQLVIRPVIYADFVDNLGNEREDNAFGSTGV